jgi:acetyl esterase/lipase
MSTVLMPPLIPIPQQFDVAIEDIAYQHHGGAALLARLYRPVGHQATVAVVDVHGGAWVVGDRTQHQAMDQAMAAHGVLVASVDFRQPPGNPYPTSLQDVNFAVRWLKHTAPALGASPTCRIGAFGGSSGGHVVILAGLRPRDPRYAALPLAAAPTLDASLAFVIADAPVTDPYTRYLTSVAAGRTDVVERHHLYWPADADAIDGNPNRILQRGESVDLPPLLITQGTADQSVPIATTREFVERYRQAGGDVQLLTFDGLGHGFILHDPARPESIQQAEAVRAFIDRHNPA